MQLSSSSSETQTCTSTGIFARRAGRAGRAISAPTLAALPQSALSGMGSI